MKVKNVLIAILVSLSLLTSQTNLEAKYSFLLKEYKSLKQVNQSLRQESANDRKIYNLGMKRSAISNQIITIQTKSEYQKRQQIGTTIYNVLVVASFVGGFLTGLKINSK